MERSDTRRCFKRNPFMTDQETIISELERLLVGPDLRPNASTIDLSARPLRLATYSPYRSADGEEILRGVRPSQRYGVGILFPMPDDEGSSVEPSAAADDLVAADDSEPTAASDALDEVDPTEGAFQPDVDEGDEIVPHAHEWRYRPCTLGLSFLVEALPADELVITVSGGRYEYIRRPPEDVLLEDGTSPKRHVQFWRRHAVSVTASVAIGVVSSLKAVSVPAEFPDPLQLQISVIGRPWPAGLCLLTVTLINRAPRADNDQRCLFQARMSCEIHRNGKPQPAIVPYPERETHVISDEDASLNLWYRDVPRFATGHGCPADWDATSPDRASRVFAAPMPVYRLPEIAPDIGGHAPEMMLLAGAGWRAPIQDLVNAYEQHLGGLDLDAVPECHKQAAEEQLCCARECLERMRRGLECLDNDPLALKAFSLANEAMRLQQIAWRYKTREFTGMDGSSPAFSAPYRSPTKGPEDGREPRWRAFQIAFILMNIPCITRPEEAFRDLRQVDLIWFPTGGGKTEAYLGLAAFAMLYSRLRDTEEPSYVHVLMRYTMRLLTAQQYQRAAGLICALECLRNRAASALGETPFRLGIWVGSAMTPNTRRDAVKIVKDLRGGRRSDRTLFVHSRCPWCAAEVGEPVKLGDAWVILGVKSDDRDATLRCSDKRCPFHQEGLPMEVVDESIVECRPSLVIATVDKFALLPKKPELRALFGIGNDGHREAPPPKLIIQDELHLITDALGSMVGAFEPLLHALCEFEWLTPPKIVCSTATIRTYRSQVRRLFGREEVALFPPPELTLGGSFFAPYRRDDAGQVVRRKAYVGIFGAGFPSFQTSESRTLAALLQAPMVLPGGSDTGNRRDPYWTVVAFFSSIRELAVTHTLARTQVADSLNLFARWRGLAWASGEMRSRFLNVPELTARRKGSELTRAFTELEKTCSSDGAVDLCLATSIVEVGIDIGRLSLMCVVGQPKQFSTFIQASGRVGRQHPGVVVTLYDHTRARDRSVFEHFRAVHERLYASVEPTSITPFALPVQERAVAAVLAAAARLLAPYGGLSDSPRKVAPNALQDLEERLPAVEAPVAGLEALCWFIAYLCEWVEKTDPEELPQLRDMLRRRLREWREWQRSTWHCWKFLFDAAKDDPQMLDADPMAGERDRAIRWYVPNSMRDVDSESQLWIRSDIAPAIPGDNDDMFPREGVAADATR